MTTKSLPTPDAVNKRRSEEVTSSMIAFEGGMPTLGSHFSPMGARNTELDLQRYQIVLVSPQDGGDRTGRNLPREQGAGRLLMLAFTWNEFLTRVRRELAGSSFVEGSNVVQFGRVRVEFLSMEVWQADRPVNLTAMEFKVLRFFVLNPSRVISRDELLDEVWGYENYPCTRTVDNHVLRLRQKLESDPPHPVHFRTVHGIGYKFVP